MTGALADGTGPSWCDHCGGRLALVPGDDVQDDVHAACRTARAHEPPRYCGWCRRRMRVQVLPASWRAVCVEHGELSGPG